MAVDPSSPNSSPPCIRDGVQICILAFRPDVATNQMIWEHILSRRRFVPYNRSTNSILFAEDTAAAVRNRLQRAERLPLFEMESTACCLLAYATKPTGFQARPNLWMSMAVKLIEATGTPALIFTYGDEENPDDRLRVTGLNVDSLWGFILRDLVTRDMQR